MKRRGTMQIDRVTGLTILGAALGATLLLAAYGQADVPADDAQRVPESIPMGGAKSVTTFFVTSRGPGNGGDLGGLAGADAHCQALADAEGVSSNET